MTRKPTTYKPQSWHDERMLGVGGSEAAAAVGLSPWLDPIELWAMKRGEAPQQESTLRMRIGSLVEPAIGVLYAEQAGRKIRHHERQFVNPDYPFVRDHPDFSVVGERRLVQAKHPDVWTRDEWGAPGTSRPESIPVHYRVQGYHELAATGYDVVDFAVLFGSDFAIFTLERDDALIADLIAEEGEFWEHVLDGTLPRPAAGSGHALRKRFPHPDGTVKVASAEQEITIREYLAAREAVKSAETRRDALEAQVLLMIGDALAIEGAGSRVTWGSAAGAVKWKAVAARLAQKYLGVEGDAELAPLISASDRGEPSRRVTVARAGRSG